MYGGGLRRAEDGENKRIDDSVFRIVQGVGMLSGAMGLLFCAYQVFLRIPRYRPFLVAFYSLAFLVPYLITRWMWRRALRKGRSELDEKQRADIAAGSFNALWSVLATGLLIYLAGAVSPNLSERLQWYPTVFFAGRFARGYCS